jgi:hypothetical protein
MRTIQLTRGKVATVSDEDYERVSKLKWFAWWQGHTWYACADIDRERIYMHRFILGLERDGYQVDHLDRNGLDNQRENLRLATPRMNRHNMRKQDCTSSKYRGVSWYKRHSKWKARIQDCGKHHWLGYFDSEEAAAKAYDHEARRLFGPHAALNFPD